MKGRSLGEGKPGWGGRGQGERQELSLPLAPVSAFFLLHSKELRGPKDHSTPTPLPHP